jgi:hypothetical protein
MRLEIIEARIRRENLLPDDFVFWHWECLPHGEPTIYIKIAGGRCPLVTRGKRKGKPNYRKATDKRNFFVGVERIEVWEMEYEAETGNCRSCLGSGNVVAEIDCVAGTASYRKCSRCIGFAEKTEVKANGE